METKKYFKKKLLEKMFCSVCGSDDFKNIGIHENESFGKVRSIDFSLHCRSDHICHFKEYIKL